MQETIHRGISHSMALLFFVQQDRPYFSMRPFRFTNRSKAAESTIRKSIGYSESKPNLLVRVPVTTV